MTGEWSQDHFSTREGLLASLCQDWQMNCPSNSSWLTWFIQMPQNCVSKLLIVLWRQSLGVGGLLVPFSTPILLQALLITFTSPPGRECPAKTHFWPWGHIPSNCSKAGGHGSASKSLYILARADFTESSSESTVSQILSPADTQENSTRRNWPVRSVHWISKQITQDGRVRFWTDFCNFEKKMGDDCSYSDNIDSVQRTVASSQSRKERSVKTNDYSHRAHIVNVVSAVAPSL